MVSTLIDRLGEWNPQLFRELKGRLKPRNIAIASAISAIGQILLYLYYKSLLPFRQSYNRYCVGSPPPDWDGYSNPNTYADIPNNYCVKDLLGNWMILKQLWWLDLFICMSIIGIFALLVVGTYMLIADLSREERHGTLNFIRLSPQSAKSILIGKMLGVPILLYLVGLLALPLHLGAGLAAHIPLSLILSFYGVLIASCAFFYSNALVYGLVSAGLGGFQAWLGSGAVLFFLFLMTGVTMQGDLVSQSPFDWLTLFYPGTVLSYLVHATFLPSRTVNYLNVEDLTGLLWYGQPLWSKAWSGIGFVLLNYGLWTYWVGRGLKRRFHNPIATLLSKQQSYWISGSFVAIILGFTLQITGSYQLFDNFIILQSFLLMLFLCLIAALSPHRQALQDWARYRHQTSNERNPLWKDLIWGEKSPSTLAIALNLLIVTGYILPSMVIFSLKSSTIPVLLGLLLSANIILIYAAIAQLMLLMKTRKRLIWAAATVGALMILPIVCFGFFGIGPEDTPWMWFFSFLPMAATKYAMTKTVFMSLLSQWLAIALVGFKMTRQLRKAGESETKALLSGGQLKSEVIKSSV
ncbi:MAG: hypothetical protein AB4426_32375 [Xenococcaceae cyanobacterium]